MTCYECNASGSELSYSSGGELLCPTCWDSRYGYCDECSEIVFRSELSSGICSSCWEEDEYNSSDWNYHSMPGEHTSLFYGIELEIGVQDYSIGDLKYYFRDLSSRSHFTIKGDCSIYDCGGVKDDAEVVSHPMTYKYLMNHQDLWNCILRSRREGALSYKLGSCGMHIHISRRYFNEDHLYRFLRMVYNQPSFTRVVSQRKRKDLNTWARLNKHTKQDMREKIKRSFSQARYEAVNITNRETIELRLFRGTLKEETFWKNLEYTHALVEFTKTAKDRHLTLKKFIRYIKQHKTTFPNLNSWLCKKYEQFVKNPNKRTRPIMKQLKTLTRG